MTFEPDANGKLFLGYHNGVIPPLERQQRDTLRTELERMTEMINAAIAAGWRVTKIDHMVQIEEGGFSILLELEKV